MDRHARRAVIGAGTWGTTLALHLAKTGPVLLLARDQQQAQEIGDERQNRPTSTGITLPVEVEVTVDLSDLASAGGE
jgi:glycerol-3-phosphate dehydrogenase (NAD(P)+)